MIVQSGSGRVGGAERNPPGNRTGRRGGRFRRNRATAVIAVSLLSILAAPNAFAYLDPGTGSLIIQLLIGAFLGLLLTTKLWWMRFKLLLARVFRGNKKDLGSGQ